MCVEVDLVRDESFPSPPVRLQVRKSMSTPMPTPQQIDELFENLGSTFTYTTQDINQAKESANRILEGVENLQSIFERQVRIQVICFIGP